MKRRAKYVFLSWLRTLVNKLSPDDIVSYHYDDMEDAMEDWLEIYADEPRSYDSIRICKTYYD